MKNKKLIKMLRTHLASELKPAKSIKVAGWIDEIRILGKIIFVSLRDSSGFVQVTAKNENNAKLFNEIKNLKKEAVILVDGDCVKNKTAKTGIEVIPKKVTVLSAVKDVLPIDMSTKIETTLEKRLDARCLDLRREEGQAIFKIQSNLITGMQEYLNKHGFTQVFTPCLMGVASEGGSDVFEVDYFGKRKAFLRQDPQLHRQLTIAGGFEKIYDIGASWRAEKSHTTQHLTEHRTCAVEFAFIENEYDVMELEQEMVKFALKKLMKDCKQELKLFDVKLLVPDKFPVLEFPKLYDILEELGEKTERGKESYSTEGEKKLGDYVRNKFKSDFYFVNRFPFAEKPFYVMRVDDEPTWARSTDFMFRGIELSSGGQREHRYDKIMEQAKIKGMKPESVAWFANFFKYGVPPHGGFALGLERLTLRLLGLANIREAVLFPRDDERLTP